MRPGRFDMRVVRVAAELVAASCAVIGMAMLLPALGWLCASALMFVALRPKWGGW